MTVTEHGVPGLPALPLPCQVKSSDTQEHAGTCRDSQGHAGTCRDSQEHAGTRPSMQGHAGACRDTQTHAGTRRDTRQHPDGSRPFPWLGRPHRGSSLVFCRKLCFRRCRTARQGLGEALQDEEAKGRAGLSTRKVPEPGQRGGGFSRAWREAVSPARSPASLAAKGRVSTGQCWGKLT